MSIYVDIFIDMHRQELTCLAVARPSGGRRSLLLQLFETSAQSTSACSTSAAEAQHKRSNALKHVQRVFFVNMDLQIASKCGSSMFKKYQKMSCSKKYPICVKCTSSVPCASKFLSSYSHLAMEGCPLRLRRNAWNRDAENVARKRFRRHERHEWR